MSSRIKTLATAGNGEERTRGSSSKTLVKAAGGASNGKAPCKVYQ